MKSRVLLEDIARRFEHAINTCYTKPAVAADAHVANHPDAAAKPVEETDAEKRDQADAVDGEATRKLLKNGSGDAAVSATGAVSQP